MTLMGIHVVAPLTGIGRFAVQRSPRIALVTDASSTDSIPFAMREICDTAVLGDLSSMGKRIVPENADGALVWCKGERPLSGSAADWRTHFFSQPPCNAWVVVHWPCLEQADLLGIEPRVRLAGAKGTIRNSRLRMAGSAPSAKMKDAWSENAEPWARLSMALWKEYERPGASIGSLQDLWETGKFDPTLSALVLRNLVVVLLRRGEWSKAEELLELGKKTFAGYSELSYVHAISCILQQNSAKAIKFLKSAMIPGNDEFVSGLRGAQFGAALDSATSPTFSRQALREGHTTWRGARRPPGQLDLRTQLQPPPALERPRSGKLVCISRAR